jgi:glycopeptide antibiotics resistance protein
VVLTVIAGFLLSLFIELAQVWIPTRVSQMADLGLNTAGAWVGALFARGRTFGHGDVDAPLASGSRTQG